MSEFTFTIDARSLRRFRDANDPNRFFTELMVQLGVIGERLAGRVVRESLTGATAIDFPGRRGRRLPLARRTGATARAVTSRTEKVRGVPAIRVGLFRQAATPGAAILETGGVIRARRGGALAIPTEKATTGSGVDRFGGPRGYPGELKFVPFRNSGIAVGKLVDPRESADGDDIARLRAVYILMTQVRIPAFRWLSTPVRDNLPFVVEQIREFIVERYRRAR